MAFCLSCGHEISQLAERCPKCGHPNEARPVGELADFWSRFAAIFIDVLVLSIPGAIVGSALPFFGGLVVGFLYDWLMVAYNNGQTVGKIALRIKVARPDGSFVDSGVAASRAAMEIVSGLALGLGYLWAAWDPENKTWHDMVADTRVFRVPR